jgi:hypothetical protein
LFLDFVILYRGRFLPMHIAKSDIPAAVSVPGAVARQITGFGDATGYGKMAGEYFSFGAGTDIAQLLQGLEGNLCQSPHWGYVLEGGITVTYADGSTEAIAGGDLFYLPPGHSVASLHGAEIVLFSPQNEHCAVVEHIRKQLAAH